MTRTEADTVLAELELVPCAEGAVPEAKELERQLLTNDIPSVLQRPPPKGCCSGGCACGSKLQVLVREEDVPRVQALMRAEWLESVRREGTLGEDLVPVKVAEAEGEADGEPACPACGHAGPLVESACGDCGLVLDD